MTRPPGIRAKWLVNNDTIGIGKIELLQKIDECGSISGAARAMDMGYRRAWTLLTSLQQSFAAPLVETVRGGNEHGGAVVTPLGRELIARFAAHEAEIMSGFAETAGWLASVQADMPAPLAKSDSGAIAGNAARKTRNNYGTQSKSEDK